jgi:hypothetical protein
MAEIRLRIFTENNKTRTGFVVKGDDTLVFQNGSDQTLRVTVDNADAISEHGKGPTDLFKIEPGQQKSFSGNAGCGHDSTFKYTATIGRSEAEDPVIIIDRH